MTPAGEDLGGLPFLYTPKHKYHLGVSLDLIPASRAGSLTFFANYAWQDDQFAGFTTLRVPGVDIPSYGLVNVRLEWTDALGTSGDIAVFGNNVTDREYRIANNAHYESLGHALTQYGEPKMWGVSLRLDFQ